MKKIIKILPALLLCVFAFNFINSEIIEQLDGRVECQQTHDYCKLVETASVKSSASDRIINKDFILIDFIGPHCLKIENTKKLYKKNQNNEFFHLVLESTYLINQSFLI